MARKDGPHYVFRKWGRVGSDKIGGSKLEDMSKSEYTVRVVDVFAMPQSGTSVSVEVVDHVIQTNMLDMLKQTGRSLLLLCRNYFNGIRMKMNTVELKI